MEIVGLGFFLEDLTPGRKFRSVSRTITEPDLVNYINATGLLEVLFTNTEFLKSGSAVKGRLVPGMMAYALIEGILTQSVMQGTGLAFLGMEVKIENPVFVGDTIHAEVEVLEARPSKSRPGTGIVRTRNQVVKHDGTVALTYTPVRLVKSRSGIEGSSF
jgi:acyl dehydratase